jgi:HD-GYP domain-containing protein (c-di-GMP phosphodiesterase class II)
VYARGRDRDAALEELRENVGSHLDERVVEALIRVVKRQALQAERRKRVRHPRAA